MIKHNQDGAVSGVAISLIITIVFLIAALGFAGWAYTSRQDYKNNSDQKAAVAAEQAKQQESIAKNKEFAETSKKPLKTYAGPEAYGGLHLEYPKTWSGYVDDSGTGTALLDAYFSPNVVPPTSNKNSVFALRAQVINQTYAQVLQTFSSQQQAGKLTAVAYTLPKLPKVVGVMLTGQINDNKNVTMVVLPLRSQTIEIWTEGNQFTDDFSRNILPYITFSP